MAAPRRRRVIAASVLAAVAAATAALLPVTGAWATSVPPAPSPQVVGALANPSVSPTLAKVTSVFTTMKKTVYSHKYVENTRTGYYAWDCVGMTDWILHPAAPNAWAAMHTTLSIRTGYVPQPTAWATYLQGTLPPSWQRITAVGDLRPGDYLLLPANKPTRFVGHAMIVAGPPRLMSDGSYALRVYDSTGTAHGPYDSRLTDTRAVGHSGLGNGTIRVYVARPGRTISGAAWAINYPHVPTLVGIPLIVGRALN
jgi:hypothetical protein